MWLKTSSLRTAVSVSCLTGAMTRDDLAARRQRGPGTVVLVPRRELPRVPARSADVLRQARSADSWRRGAVLRSGRSSVSGQPSRLDRRRPRHLGEEIHKGIALQRAKRLLGEGLLTSEGQAHLRQRRTIQPLFHRQQVQRFAEAMVQHALRWRDSIRAGRDDRRHERKWRADAGDRRRDAVLQQRASATPMKCARR